MKASLKLDRQQGFTLIEVMIGLVLSAMLMSMVSMVLGQSITNNEVVRNKVGLSSRMFTLRRILHRDFQSSVPGTSIAVEDSGFQLTTMNNHLLDSGLKVTVEWDFSDNMIRRSESSGNLKYEDSFLLARRVSSWQVDLLESKTDVWVSLLQYKNQPLHVNNVIKAVRISLTFENGKSVTMVERVPYAYE